MIFPYLNHISSFEIRNSYVQRRLVSIWMIHVHGCYNNQLKCIWYRAFFYLNWSWVIFDLNSRYILYFVCFQNTCKLEFTADTANSYISSGWYAVALTVEDFPKTTITINGQIYTPSMPISKIPLQVSKSLLYIHMMSITLNFMIQLSGVTRHMYACSKKRI